LITIANVGIGNFASIANMYKYLEIDVQVISDPRAIRRATHLILPGVGAFDPAMRMLNEMGWKDALLDLEPGTKLLGICLGMQLLTIGSEEGSSPGLGLINSVCKRFKSKDLKVPHIGWNQVHANPKNLLISAEEVNYFYFSHSYYVECIDENLVQASTTYGSQFTAQFGEGNIHGVQFHPEKSHKYGMNLLSKFASL